MTRSTSPWGPFELCPNNPILTQRNRNTQNALIQGAGHADMVDAVDGSWWMVFLAFRQVASHHHLGRETYLTPLSWTSTGWPLVPFDGTAQLENYTKTLPLRPFVERPAKDEFNANQLDLHWNFMRNPLPNSWSLTDRKGFLRINGKKGSLDSIYAAQFIGQRQQYFDADATTQLEFNPQKDNEEAGLSVYHRYEGHYDLFVRKKGNERELVLRYTLGKIHHTEKIVPLSKGPVQLKVAANKTSFSFYYAQGGEFKLMGLADAKFISSETLQTFTGVFLGMYATGNDHDSETPADFDWFEIKEIPTKL
jgi:alpha-N-arabinofuranosidase